MNNKDIITHRLVNHQIAATAFTEPEEIVSYYGAMQAQDWAMAKWALGLRLSHLTDSDVEEKFNQGKILRTHVLRPTWHFILPKDIRWIQKLTSPRVHQANKLYYKKSDINPRLISKTESVLVKALEGKNHLTRDELNDQLKKNKIIAEGMRLAYIMMHAELECLICSGPRRGKQFTYALLDEIYPATKDLSPEAALKKLAHIYFNSRSPATVHDFAWWSGLTLKEVRNAVEMLDRSFMTEKIEGREYIIKPIDMPDLKNRQTTFLIPDYDEYAISYKNRDVYLHPKWSKVEKLSNSDYFHAIAVDGYFGGSWNKKTAGKTTQVSIKPFASLTVSQKNKVNKAVKSYQKFLAIE